MGLDAALGIASGSLANITLGLSIVSQNVANASTPGYAVENAAQQSLDAGGVGIGVRSGNVLRSTDAALQSELQGQTAEAAFWQTTDAALASIEPVLGTVGSSTDLGSKLAKVQSAFSALLTDPSNQTQQAAVVDSATHFAQGVNSLAKAVGQARQTAQDGLVTGVAQLNLALHTIGSLSDRIVALQGQGLSTADLENQRDQAVTAIASLVDARFIPQSNGDLMVLTKGGAQLPTHSSAPLSIASASAGPTSFYPGGGLPGIMLGGSDITAQLRGGSLAANVNLRDAVLPSYQAGLDEFAHGIAARFDAQGLTLFTDPQGALPAGTGPSIQSGYVGFSGTMSVNPAVAADPALVRDGTRTVVGSPTGAAAFTPNPLGLAGFTDMISRVLDFALGTEVQSGVAQATGPVAGLGPSGTLGAAYANAGTPAGFAVGLTASLAQDSNGATSRTADALGVQASFQNKLTGETGVDLDTELSHMIQLQNAYGANAKIISAVQSMLTQILNAVQ